ncbi:MAG: PsbP-related protein [Parcubacteria group bacterium]
MKVLFILILIIVALTLWFGFIKDDGGDVVVDGMHTETPTPADTETPDDIATPVPPGTPSDDEDDDQGGDIISDTSDWQVITNEREGYEVKIHPWWWWSRYYNVDDETVSILGFDTSSLEDKPYSSAPIQIRTTTDERYLDDVAPQCLKSYDRDYCMLLIESSENIKVDGVSGKRFLNRGDSNEAWGLHRVVVEHDDLIYEFSFNESGGDHLDIFNTIVDSFRFLD